MEDDSQLALIEVAPLNLPKLLDGERTLAHTLRDVNLVKAAADRLVMGQSYRKVAHDLGMGRDTVAELANVLEERGELAPHRKRLSKRLKRIVESGTEHLLEEVEEGKRKLTSLDVGILVDKILLLDGEATQRIEIVAAPRIESLRAELAKIPEVVIDVEPVPPVALEGVQPAGS